MNHFCRKYIIAIALVLLAAVSRCPAQEAAASGCRFRETIWISTPGSIFVPGERVPFSLTLLEQDTYRHSELSRFARVELLDRDGNKLSVMTLALVNSMADGFFSLPGNLKSGVYYIRAYTNWMRNFPASDYPFVTLKVINPLEKNLRSEYISGTESRNTGTTPPVLVIDSDGTSRKISCSLPDSTKGRVRLLAHRSGTWYVFDIQDISHGNVTFSVPKVKLPEGLVQFTLLDASNRVVASRLWAESAPAIKVIDLSPDQPAYGLRSPVGIRMSLAGEPKTELPSGLQAFAVSIESLPPFVGALPGIPGWPANCQVPADSTAFSDWLGTHRYPDETATAFFTGGRIEPSGTGWSWSTDSLPEGIQYLPETRSVLLSGRVVSRKDGRPVPEVGIALSLLKTNEFNAVKTGSRGHFAFCLPAGTGKTEYALSFISLPDSAWAIEVFPEYDARPWNPQRHPFTVTATESAYATTRATELRIRSIFSNQPPDAPAAQPGPAQPFYYPPDRTVITDRFIELANVRELIYEVVPDVQVHRKGDQSFLEMYSSKPYARAYETLVLLDGIPVTDQAELLGLPSSRIRAVEVRNQLYVHGNYLFSGIIQFLSQKGDFAGIRLPRQTTFGTADQPVTNSDAAKGQEGSQTTAPVLDPVLFLLRTTQSMDPRIRFVTNDRYGEYGVRVSGFGPDGSWYSGSCRIGVAPPNL